MDSIGEKIVYGSICIFVFLSLALLTFPILCWDGCYENYSTGERSGDIYKFSKKGFFWKSWEGEMYLGGYHSTGGKAPKIEADKFYFSIPESEEVEKAELIEHIKQCSKKRETCTIQYRQWFVKPINISSEYVVIK